MENSPSNDAAGSETEAYGSFVLWMLDALRLDVRQSDGDRFLLRLPEADRPAFGGAESVSFCLAGDLNGAAGAEAAAPQSRLMRWIAGQIGQAGGVLHAAPAGQPVSVHELTPALFAAYQVEGGAVKLGGCALEDVPFVRLTLLAAKRPAENGLTVAHRFFTPKGEAVSAELRQNLHLDRLAPYPRRQAKSHAGEVAGWIDAAKSTLPDDLRDRLLAATIVWCKHASGKLSLEIGDSAVETHFRGPAQLIVDGKIAPPAYACPITGKSSHHLAAADDGRITVAEAIGVCSESGKRVLATELEKCAATGAHALAEFFADCPVSAERVLRSALVECPDCGQLVSPTVMDRTICSACRSLSAVSKDDPRMARVLGEYPRLDSWGKWRIAETSTVYILQASGLMRRLLAVVDKQSLEVLRLATAGRFSRGWTEPGSRQRSEMLR